MKKVILVFLLFCTSTVIAQNEISSCQRLHHSKLKFINDNGLVDYFQINGNEHLEYQEAGGPYIKSTLKLNNECEYTARIVEVSFVGGFFKVGDELTATILKIVDNTVYMKTIFKEFEMEFTYEIVEYL